MSKSMIGLDPLAWLSPEVAAHKPAANTKAAKKKSTKKKSTKKKTAKKKITAKKKSVSKKRVVVKKKTVTNNPVTNKYSDDTPQLIDVEEQVEAEVVTEAKDTNAIVASESEPNKLETKESIVTDSTIKLVEVQDISQVEELYASISGLINNHDIIFDGSEVERIDASSLQLIASTFIQAKKYGNTISWNASSNALKQSAKLLGLTNIIGL